MLLAALLVKAPIAQIEGYHRFADTQTYLHIPHFWNVATNLPFLVVGVMGMWLVARGSVGAAKAEWFTLFAGTALVGLGSSYYHLAPEDATLVWDRLPIGIAFMGFLAALVAEHVSERAGRWLLVPGIIFAIAAVYWWRYTGDLAPWVWVQLGPMLAIVMALVLFPGHYSHRRYFAYALACYVVAKLFELGDHRLMEWTGGLMSGHPLKHLAAAAGVLFFYLMLKRRAPKAASPATQAAATELRPGSALP